jgi:hypothetical protein
MTTVFSRINSLNTKKPESVMKHFAALKGGRFKIPQRYHSILQERFE